ncbi:MAG TPA: matrixin family metalloprotease [Thermoanaerobaculia bacterium]|nr:matrixin family metalloprotease [Thermoanaerobaculia bacterium]
MRSTATFVSLLAVLPMLATAPPATADDGVLTIMRTMNDDLKAMWMDFRIESIDYLTVDRGRPSDRLLNHPFRWVDGDPRRSAEPGNLSVLVDGSWGEATASGLDAHVTAGLLAGAVRTWAADTCLGVEVVERRWEGGDVTVTDYFFGDGPLGDPFAADLVFGGWLGADRFFFRPNTLAVTVTYVFVDRASGEPTDVDGDGNLDVALAEIYFNDSFDWTIDGTGGFDLTTAALHEVGHALDLGHFGPPPAAVMNPVYSGPRRALEPIDHAGLCSVWGDD